MYYISYRKFQFINPIKIDYLLNNIYSVNFSILKITLVKLFLVNKWNLNEYLSINTLTSEIDMRLYVTFVFRFLVHTTFYESMDTSNYK